MDQALSPDQFRAPDHVSPRAPTQEKVVLLCCMSLYINCSQNRRSSHLDTPKVHGQVRG